MKSHLIFAALVFMSTGFGCSSSDSEEKDAADPDTTSTMDGENSNDGAPTVVVPEAPTNAEDLVPWLEAGNYLEWAAEPEYHESQGPHGDAVKVFYSPAALDGIQASESVLRPGGALVKELTSGGSLYGWGVYVRLSDEPSPQSIYYYELIKPDQIYGDANGSSECTGCHRGVEVILSDVSVVMDL